MMAEGAPPRSKLCYTARPACLRPYQTCQLVSPVIELLPSGLSPPQPNTKNREAARRVFSCQGHCVCI